MPKSPQREIIPTSFGGCCGSESVHLELYLKPERLKKEQNGRPTSLPPFPN